MPKAARRGLALGFTLVCVALPFCVVTFPPSTDLPQHVAQIRLLQEALAGGTRYQINWWAPNNLVYALLAALWQVLPPLQVGRAALLLIALAWAGSLAALAEHRQRPCWAAVMAGTLVFQPALYWGLLNFMVGWPLFLAWLMLILPPKDASPTIERPLRHGLAMMTVALLLYAGHVLWLAMALVWMALVGVIWRPSRRLWVIRGLAVLPALSLVARWHPSFREARAAFDVGAHWSDPVWRRLLPQAWLHPTYGSLSGWAGKVVLSLLLAVLAFAMRDWLRRRDFVQSADRPLLLAAALLGGFALLAPTKYMNTIFFDSRWIPGALALLVLGLPVGAVAQRLQVRVSVLAMALLSLMTSVTWWNFEHTQLAGFSRIIAQAPSAARLLGLDFAPQSDLVGCRPFMHLPAYLQAVHGGEINFSFAEHGSSIVSYRAGFHSDWTRGVEWEPERHRPTDIARADVILVNGDPTQHEQFVASALVEPLGEAGGRIRLYRKKR